MENRPFLVRLIACNLSEREGRKSVSDNYETLYILFWKYHKLIPTVSRHLLPLREHALLCHYDEHVKIAFQLMSFMNVSFISILVEVGTLAIAHYHTNSLLPGLVKETTVSFLFKFKTPHGYDRIKCSTN